MTDRDHIRSAAIKAALQSIAELVHEMDKSFVDLSAGHENAGFAGLQVAEQYWQDLQGAARLFQATNRQRLK
jgi:hypothetical protein